MRGNELKTVILESSLLRLIEHNKSHDCIIQTAFKGTNTRTSNRGNNFALGKVLEHNGFWLTKVIGHYPEADGKHCNEESWFVVNGHDNPKFINICANLAEYDDQESILVLPKGSMEAGSGAYLYGTLSPPEDEKLDTSPKYHEKMFFDKIVFGDDKREMFTVIKNRTFAFDFEAKPKDELFDSESYNGYMHALGTSGYCAEHYNYNLNRIVSK